MGGRVIGSLLPPKPVRIYLMSVQYSTSVDWDITLADLGLTSNGLVCTGLKTTTGAPTATAGKFIPAAVIQNIVTGILYQNTGTTASPVWSVIESSGAGNLFDVVAAGKFTTVGGDADEQATVAGVVATDIVVASIQTEGAVPVTLLASAPGVGAIDFTMSADPDDDHIISYVVYRAA